jgi:hypothetical protein
VAVADYGFEHSKETSMPFQSVYVNIPTVSEWKRDAYVTSTDALDPISAHIVSLIEELQKKRLRPSLSVSSPISTSRLNIGWGSRKALRVVPAASLKLPSR